MKKVVLEMVYSSEGSYKHDYSSLIEYTKTNTRKTVLYKRSKQKKNAKHFYQQMNTFNNNNN